MDSSKDESYLVGRMVTAVRSSHDRVLLTLDDGVVLEFHACLAMGGDAGLWVEEVCTPSAWQKEAIRQEAAVIRKDVSWSEETASFIFGVPVDVYDEDMMLVAAYHKGRQDAKK